MPEEKALNDASYEAKLHAVMTKVFGFTSLSTEQHTLIRESVNGRNTLGILPTGSGKSACYQIPGVMTGVRTLVVSPLIALQDDQVQALRQRGIDAFAFHSDLPEPARQAARFYFSRPTSGRAAFLYVSPETLVTDMFCNAFAGAGFDRLVVDEAHCVSTWGNSFRPDYQRITASAKRLGILRCSAFTATVDPLIERDIRARIPLTDNHVRVFADPTRPNLNIKVERPTTDDDTAKAQGSKKTSRLLRLLDQPHQRGPTIVYCAARDTATSLFLRLEKRSMRWLKERGYGLYLYHAKLPYEDKEMALRGFLTTRRPIVIATTAFGMGIDRPDVRQVIHYTTPYTLLDYAQQIGRAGRNGQPAFCTTLFASQDLLADELKRRKIEVPEYDFVERMHERLTKRLGELTPEQRQDYSVRLFLKRQQALIEASPRITNKEGYLHRTTTAINLLIRAGAIRHGKPLSVVDIEQGSDISQKLIELTQMHSRMEIRQAHRLAQFFEAQEPDQSLLWQLLSAD